MRAKFSVVDPSLALRALTYCADVERQPMPDMLAKTSWDEVKTGSRSHSGRARERDGPSR
jgi:hypothetical protein